MPPPMIDCLSDNQVAELLSGPLADDQTINAHLDQCAACVAIVAAALGVTTEIWSRASPHTTLRA